MIHVAPFCIRRQGCTKVLLERCRGARIECEHLRRRHVFTVTVRLDMVSGKISGNNSKSVNENSVSIV